MPSELALQGPGPWNGYLTLKSHWTGESMYAGLPTSYIDTYYTILACRDTIPSAGTSQPILKILLVPSK